MVTPLSRGIKKYILGLPMQIQDTVWGRNPPTLEDAIRLAATLSDNHVKAGTLTLKDKKSEPKPTTPTEPLKITKPEPSSHAPNHNQKRKSHNFAMVTPATPLNQYDPNKRQYTGKHPQCLTCTYHHPPHFPCSVCNNCGRYGHWTYNCRLPLQVHMNPHLNSQPQPNNRAPNPRTPNTPATLALTNGPACYGCGEPGHLQNACPKLANKAQGGARGRVYHLISNDDQIDTEAEEEGNPGPSY